MPRNSDDTADTRRAARSSARSTSPGPFHTLHLIGPAGVVGHHVLTPFSTACARRCCSQRLDCPATGNSSAALALAVMAAASPSACDSYRDSVEQAAEPECEALSSGQVHRTAGCCPEGRPVPVRLAACAVSDMAHRAALVPAREMSLEHDRALVQPVDHSGGARASQPDLRAVVSNVELQRPAPDRRILAYRPRTSRSR
jgi:hypothetical protein